MLSNSRSFRTHTLRELVGWDQSEAYIRGIVQAGGEKTQRPPGTKTLAVKIKTNARTLSINSKQCRSSKEYLQVLPSVTFVPEDLDLIKGLPAYRRHFLDKGTFHFYPPYWSLLIEYNTALRQKNALLREFKTKEGQKNIGKDGMIPQISIEDSCDIWNTQLRQTGSKIIAQRILFIHNLQRLLRTIYTTWLGGEETLELQYKSTIKLPKNFSQKLLSAEDVSPEQIQQHTFELYDQAIQRNREREYYLKTTVTGPHRDDLEVYSDGKLIRSYGSQGQQRTAVLALKLAEAYLYFEQYAEHPILLLDDVTSELDLNRNSGLFKYLQHKMQVFISATNKLDFPSLHHSTCKYFELPSS